jgi:hypothetical protein
MAEKYIKKECTKRYGFHSNPNEPKWRNKKKALTTMDTSLLLGQQTQNLKPRHIDTVTWIERTDWTQSKILHPEANAQTRTKEHTRPPNTEHHNQAIYNVLT